MTELAHQFLDWISANPGAALALLFFGSALDAIFIVGAFVPAGVLLFGVGALVGLDRLALWPSVLLAASGAVLGDALSFWLGRHYGEKLFEHRWLARYPDTLARSRRFFEQHGGKGVMAARFLGPVRAITPALAGASRMPTWLFLLTDGCAAIVWALAYLGPGIAFGASLELAAEVAGRLALLVVGLFLLALLAFALARGLVASLAKHAEHWLGRLLDYSRRHRRLGRFGAALADPHQPETPVLAVLAVLLSLFGGLLLILCMGTALHAAPLWLDAATYQSLRELRSPWGVGLAALLVQLGDWRVYGAVGLVVLVGLAAGRQPRAVAHWLAAAGFGALLSFGMGLVPLLPAPHVYFQHPPTVPGAGRDLPLAITLYGFLAVVLTTGRSPLLRALVYGLAITLVSLLSLAQLYLGMVWLSQAVAVTLTGVVWVALLGLGYRRHRARPVPGGAFLLLVPVAICLAFLLRPPAPEGAVPPDAGLIEQRMLEEHWWQDGWQQLPMQRVDLAGRARQPFNLQWAGDPEAIRASLERSGWSVPPGLIGSHVLRWLSLATPMAELPLLPQAHAGRHQTLLMRRDGDASRQITLRLWASGVGTETGHPIWLGMIDLQQRRRLLFLLHVPLTLPDTPDLAGLLLPLSGMDKRLVGQDLWLLRQTGPSAAAEGAAPPPPTVLPTHSP